MIAAIWGTFATGAGLLAVFRTASRLKQTRREMRYRSQWFGAVSLLDDRGAETPCRIINASRSGLRIACSRQFSKGSQVCVHWGGRFFVGPVIYSFASGADYVAGLELTSGNHQWLPLTKLCFWRRFARNRA